MSEKMYLIKYYYIRSVTDKKIKRVAKYFIFPKMYNSIISEEQKEKLATNTAFLCATSPKEGVKPSKVPAFILSIIPATGEDLKKYKPLNLIAPITPNKDQLKALDNFQKIKFGIK